MPPELQRLFSPIMTWTVIRDVSRHVASHERWFQRFKMLDQTEGRILSASLASVLILIASDISSFHWLRKCHQFDMVPVMSSRPSDLALCFQTLTGQLWLQYVVKAYGAACETAGYYIVTSWSKSTTVATARSSSDQFVPHWLLLIWVWGAFSYRVQSVNKACLKSPDKSRQ